jgi:hypothetical protein
MRFAPFAKAGFVLVLAASFSACGGGGGGPGPSPGGPPPSPGGPPPATVAVSGKITFERIPFDTTLGSGLNPNAPAPVPARGVVVEALSSTGSVLANSVTDANGDYVVTVPISTQITIRAKAQMLKAGTGPTWNFQVLNNANSDALYALDSSVFDSGTANVTRNLRAASGWGSTGYTQTRAAAPFAILDTIYSATTLITSAQSATVFEPLNLYWSSSNRSNTVNQNGDPILCIDDGDVQTSFYTPGGDADDCQGTVPAGIYVLGSFEEGSNGSGGDTDEFDQHVIAHEFGHYIEDKFSRSDSIGGPHGGGDNLDPRVAFGEGWGNAFAGMVLNNPVYRDSFSGASDDFGFSLEQDFNDDGWYSEASVGEILWDVFDPANEPLDPSAAGFGPIFNAMSNGQRTTAALTSIFSFATALKNAAPSESSNINALLQNEAISGADEFGSGENNNGGFTSPPSVNVLPLYRPLSASPQLVCVRASDGQDSFNKLGFYKFFRFSLSAATSVSFNLSGQADPSAPTTTQIAVDPDIWIYRQGAVVFQSEATGQSETETLQLEAGSYVVELFDFNLIETSANSTRCMTISATGI